jgi:hypothetical protein
MSGASWVNVKYHWCIDVTALWQRGTRASGRGFILVRGQVAEIVHLNCTGGEPHG